MENKKIYSAVVFLILSLVVINSVILMGANDKIQNPNLRSILKTAENDNSNTAIADTEVADGEISKRQPKPNEGPTAEASVQSACGGVVIEQSSKRVLLDENMNVRCYPASTTKVLTALVVLERLPIDRVVTVPKQAEGVEGSSIYLRAGQKITVGDLLLGLMLRSGNDSAVTLAIATAGSVEAFAQLMNDTARELGANSSNFVNPHGLHDDNHYTTAYDLALITAKAYENSDFRRIVSTSKAKITIDGEAHYIGNKNKMLTLYEGANGVKTGYTKKSGRCLVSGASRGGMQLISVVLNYNDMWNDSMRLLNYGFDNYEMTSLENSFARKNPSANPVVIENIAVDPESFLYPLRKDGSEYLTVKGA